MRWFGIDPGETTGCAWWDDSSADLDGVAQVSAWDLLHQHTSGRAGGLAGADPHLRLAVFEIVKMIQTWKPDVVVIEDFTLRLPAHNAQRSGLSPVRVISMLEIWLTEVVPGPSLRYQQPGERTIMTDARLRARGWWRTPKQGGGPHAMDAARHLAVAYRKEHKKP